MYQGAAFYLVITSFVLTNGHAFNFEKFQNYSKIFGFLANESNNELWHGILKDCSKMITFSCIQKNAYIYLEQTFIDRDNITVFDGLSLTKNKLDYDAYITDDSMYSLMDKKNCSYESTIFRNNFDENKIEMDNNIENIEEDENEYLTPLEEVTHAIRKKTVRFLATRDYQIQLPHFIAEGISLKISPRKIDNTGALIRVDFSSGVMEKQHEGRLFFKKIKKQIQNKLLIVLLVLILLIKIIKLKFMFVIPFLFGIGTAKKLFLKLLLFFVPAFAHVFKLCSSYYSSHATKYHHHHHKVAHHHHHIPVPVPVPYTKPVYYDYPPPHSHILEDDFQGFDYAHPHIQYRKDIEELKEWGIEPYDESYDQITPQAGVIYPGSTTPTSSNLIPKFPSMFGIPPVNTKPTSSSGFSDKISPLHLNSQNLAYSGYGPSITASLPSSSKQPSSSHPLPIGVIPSAEFGTLNPSIIQPAQQQSFNSNNDFFIQQSQPVFNQNRYDFQQKSGTSEIRVPAQMLTTRKLYDDEFYGPIVEKLDKIFNELKFLEENCRERIICSMYKNPAFYTPLSNLISNELSRDPQELQQGNSASGSSKRFLRYLKAARLGQDGGDCLRTFQCSSNIE